MLIFSYSKYLACPTSNLVSEQSSVRKKNSSNRRSSHTQISNPTINKYQPKLTIFFLFPISQSQVRTLSNHTHISILSLFFFNIQTKPQQPDTTKPQQPTSKDPHIPQPPEKKTSRRRHKAAPMPSICSPVTASALTGLDLLLRAHRCRR